MKIILSRDGMKREIEAPFEICASRLDFERLRDIIDEALKGRNFSYGWLTIAPVLIHAVNTPPRKWTE